MVMENYSQVKYEGTEADCFARGPQSEKEQTLLNDSDNTTAGATPYYGCACHFGSRRDMIFIMQRHKELCFRFLTMCLCAFIV